MYRNTYALIDLDKLSNNIKNIKEEYSLYKYYIGVVKGNAYGHGFYIVNTLIESGVNYLAVSSLEEALDVRKFNKEIPILVLEPIDIKYMDVVISNNITITLCDYEYYNRLIKLDNKDKLKVHMKIDSGMNRLGLNKKEEIEKIVNDKKVYIEGIYTHFATSGILDKHWDNQLDKFKYLTSGIDLSKIEIVHLGRSITLTTHQKINFCNGIRLGIVMYGFNNKINVSNSLKGKILSYKNSLIKKINKISKTEITNLKVDCAFSLYSEVMQVKKCQKGSFVGYGASYKLESDAYIATVPIGYYDGVNNFKHVIINGKTYEIVGQTCMDMISIKVEKEVKNKDKVCLIGEYPIKKVCSESGVSSYKILTGISNRVPRIYVKNGKKVYEE